MSSTPKFLEEALGDSWVDLNSQNSTSFINKFTQLPIVSAGEEYLRLLREAQKDNSNHSSTLVSRTSSNRNSVRGSPKSPPNSPNTEPCCFMSDEDLKGVYVNYYTKEGEFVKADRIDWIWDWSSLPDQMPPKDWKFKHPGKKTYSMRNAKVGKIGLFSKEVLYTLVLTNFLSLIIGTGMGLLLARRSLFVSSMNFE